ncbi:MAG: TIGR03663 family protein, partial [bacterium]|nr:TIGR03663 family protein [bacterium]
MSSSSPGTIRLTKYTLGIIAIVLFGVFIRLYGLDRMAFHHDESIHALFSWRLYQGMFEAYKYDPTYHGPFLYHTGALFFSLFGDNDFVARLPFVTFGVLLFYLIWRAKDWLGQTGTLVTLFLVATSPSMTYFARFARNDVYMAAFAMGIVAFALDYLRTRKDIYLVWMTIFLTLMYSCKENSYMTGFILGSYIVFYGVYYFLSYAPGIRKQGCVEIIGKRAPFVKLLSLYGIFSCTAFSLVYFVTRLELFKTTATARKEMVMAESYNIGILQHAWNHVTQSHSWIVPMWIWVGLAATAAVFLLLLFIQYRIKSEGETFSLRRIARENAVVLTCILIALLIYSFLFTTMGHNRTGMKAGVVDYLLYWMGQQDNPRIEGEASYFIPRILLYEPMTVVFAVIAFLVYTFSAFSWRNFLAFQFTFWSTVNLYCQVVLLHGENAALALVLWILSLCVVLGLFIITRLFPSRSESPDAQEESGWRPDGVRVFFIYWSVFSLLIYAALNEKVPWLMVHQVQPLILLAGIFIGDVLDRLPSPALRRVFIALLVVLAVYEVRTNIHLNM